MDDDERKAPGGAAGNRTIQIDALTDVELVDHHAAEDDDGSNAGEAAVVGRAPPPLPPKQRSPLKVAGLTIVAVVTGALCALGIVHFLLPSSAPTTAGTPPSDAPAPAVRRVQLDDELVIRTAPAEE